MSARGTMFRWVTLPDGTRKPWRPYVDHLAFGMSMGFSRPWPKEADDMPNGPHPDALRPVVVGGPGWEAP